MPNLIKTTLGANTLAYFGQTGSDGFKNVCDVNVRLRWKFSTGPPESGALDRRCHVINTFTYDNLKTSGLYYKTITIVNYDRK
jgi:hypothetical protein